MSAVVPAGGGGFAVSRKPWKVHIIADDVPGIVDA
jgi:hypothetical protein